MNKATIRPDTGQDDRADTEAEEYPNTELLANSYPDTPKDACWDTDDCQKSVILLRLRSGIGQTQAISKGIHS